MMDMTQFIESPSVVDAWIAPDGTYYQVRGSKESSHWQFAKEWLSAKGITDFHQIENAVTVLENMGWLHLSGGWLFGDSARNPDKITEAQMDALMTIGRDARESTHFLARTFLEAFAAIMQGGSAF